MNKSKTIKQYVTKACLKYVLLLKLLCIIAVSLFVLFVAKQHFSIVSLCMEKECPPATTQTIISSIQGSLPGFCPFLACNHHDEHCFKQANEAIIYTSPYAIFKAKTPVASEIPYVFIRFSDFYQSIIMLTQSFRPYKLHLPPSNLIYIKTVVLRL